VEGQKRTRSESVYQIKLAKTKLKWHALEA